MDPGSVVAIYVFRSLDSSTNVLCHNSMSMSRLHGSHFIVEYISILRNGFVSHIFKENTKNGILNS